MSAALYETDFAAWTSEQAALLRAGQFDALDMDNLVEEIEDMGLNQRSALKSQTCRLVMHLLKWQFQPELLVDGSNPSWEVSINNARNAIESILEESPSLVRELPSIVAKEYPRAKRQAIRETRKPSSLFPDTCPYSLEQLQDFDWLPT